jgi:hypothetical protein
MPPDVPAGTMAALATICPCRSFSVETTGCDCPPGQALRYSRDPAGTTVMLNEYARAVVGNPQELVGTGKVRVPPAPSDGPPNVSVALRVSATRHGVTG